jgi:hypothetical protein
LLIACVTRPTFLKVNSSAITARHPSVPNLMFSDIFNIFIYFLTLFYLGLYPILDISDIESLKIIKLPQLLIIFY